MVLPAPCVFTQESKSTFTLDWDVRKHANCMAAWSPRDIDWGECILTRAKCDMRENLLLLVFSRVSKAVKGALLETDSR